MKFINYRNFFAAMAFAGLLTACSKEFIDRPPQDAIVDVNFYKTSEQVLAGSAPLYNIVWFAYNDKASHGIGDGRGGVLTSGSYQVENIEFRTTATTGEVSTSWRSFYNVVGQANTLISNLNQYTDPAVPENIKQHAIAEARFMRGLAYSYLVQNWGPVPIITDNVNNLQDTTITRNTEESVWEFICRDLRFATEYLPETPVQSGRLTKWAAKGMLAKMYLARAGVGKSEGSRDQTYLDSARVLSKEVIDNSGASLLENYEDLFKTQNNNNVETLFALQWTYNGNWGSQNSVQAFLAYGSSITGFADGWGGDIGASLYILERYEGLIDNGNTPDERRKATFMFPGDHYSYIHEQLLDDDGNPYTRELIVPVGGDGYNTRAWVKKYVVGRPEDNEGKVLQQRTEIQTYMLRLSDVYLTYAESILGNASSTADGEALRYYNLVRERAGVPVKSVITWDDIFNERLVEFAMEGHAWYDFVRLHYYNPEKAYESLRDQDRGSIRITPLPNATDPTSWTIVTDPNDATRNFVVNSGNFRIPLPEAELSRAPNLRKTPVPYNFN